MTVAARQGRGRRSVFVAVAGLWLLATAVTNAAPAGAHAYLVSTDPANGATVAHAPAAVVVTLSESVSLPSSPTAVQVTDEAGVSVVAGPARITGTRLTIGLRSGLGNGVYLVTWRLISADTHPVAGSVQFGVGVPAMAVVAPPPDDEVSPALMVAKALVYVGLVGSVGWFVVSWVLRPAGAVGVIRGGAALAIAGTFAQAVVVTQVGGGYPVDVIGWLAARALALGVLAWVPRRPVPATAASVVALLCTTRVGHGGESLVAWLVTSVHAGAAVVWLAGIAVLVTPLTRRRLSGAELARVRRWSALAASSAALVVGTGLWRAISEVGFPAALWSTDYGRVLLAKLAAVAVAVVAAFAAAVWLHRQPVGGVGPAPGQTAVLRRRAVLEVGAVGSAAVLAMVLSNLTPATVSYRPVTNVHATAGPYRAQVRIDPARTGTELIAVTLAPTGSAAAAPALSGVLHRTGVPARGDAGATTTVQFPIRVTLPAGPGEVPAVLFRSAAVTVDSAGTWSLDLTVVMDQRNRYVTRVGYDVG